MAFLPWLDAVQRLPAEDSVALDHLTVNSARQGVKIVIPVLGKIANFDDLDPLKNEPDIDLVFARKGSPLPNDAALVILPGSKSTIADMAEFRENGLGGGFTKACPTRPAKCLAFAAGNQMLGKKIRDPDGIEGDVREIRGLGLLDMDTVSGRRKRLPAIPIRYLSMGLFPWRDMKFISDAQKGRIAKHPMIRSENGF